MASFTAKSIANPLSLGEQLRATRQGLGVKVKVAAQKTGIAAKYLSALETGELQLLPGDVYAKSFLKVYARFLGLDADECVGLYESQRAIYAKTKHRGNTDFKKPIERISRLHLLVTPKIVRAGLVGLLALACLLYLGVKMKAILTPPALIIEQPADNVATANRFIEVSGQVGKEATVEINGQQVAVNSDSHFSELLDLQSGVNVIEVKAENRHGKQTKIYRQVVVADNGQSPN